MNEFWQPMQKHIFQWLHGLGWLVYWLSIFLTYYTRNDSYRILQLNNFLGLLLTYVVGFCASLTMIRSLGRIDIENMAFTRMVGRMMQIVIPFTVVWILIDKALTSLIYAGDFSGFTLNGVTLFYLLIARLPMLLFWGALHTVFRLWNAWYVQRQQAREASHLAQRAQLEMLRYQLNPHFFFNALNTIRALIDQDRVDARAMVTELSEFLRYSLTRRDRLFVPLSEEIEAVEHYLAVEKKRFEEKLVVSIDVESRAQSFSVLCFLLHPLVENAIKYGMQSSDMPLHVGIKAEVSGANLRIIVQNSGCWQERREGTGFSVLGTGTGLKNLRERLNNAYGVQHQIVIEKASDSVTVKLELTTPTEGMDSE